MIVCVRYICAFQVPTQRFRKSKESGWWHLALKDSVPVLIVFRNRIEFFRIVMTMNLNMTVLDFELDQGLKILFAALTIILVFLFQLVQRDCRDIVVATVVVVDDDAWPLVWRRRR